MTAPLNMEVHAPRNAAAYWPPGFRERADAQAAGIVARGTTPPQLAKVVELFPAALETAVKALGLAHVPDWVLVAGRDALAACITSVTVETSGAVTVIDLRSPAEHEGK